MASTSSLIIIFIPPIALLVAIVVILFLFYEPAREWLDQTRHLGYSWFSEYRARFSFLNRGTAHPYRALAETDQNLANEDGAEAGPWGDDEGEEQGDGAATGTTTSARIRMHHEMVQQMRMRAGFAPEPFPEDIQNGEDGEGNEDDDDDNDDDDDEEEDEEDGGVGSSTGVRTTSAPRIKKVGKKKAKSLQRKEQMRAYREFLEAQREERRQQEELFNVQQSAQQEERLRQRKAQQERDQRLKEQQKIKEAKASEANLAKKKKEKEKEAQTRRDLRTFIYNVKAFRMADLVKRFNRSEALLLKDLEAIAIEDAQTSESSPRIILQVPITMSASSSSPLSNIKRPDFPDGSKVVLLDRGTGMYLVLDESALRSFAHIIQENGGISKQGLSAQSKHVLHPLAASQ